MIPILKLKALENRIIKTFPNALNRMDYFRSLYTSVQDGNGALHAHDKKCDSRVGRWRGETSITVYRLQSGPVVPMAAHSSDTI